MLAPLIRVQAQSIAKADSLRNILMSESLHDTTQWEVLTELSRYETDLKASLVYGETAYKLAQRIGNPYFIARSLEEIADIQRRLGNISDAFTSTLSALRIYELEGDPRKQAAIFSQLGSHSVGNQQFKEANAYYFKALTLYERYELGRLGYALTTLNLGESYRLIPESDSAILYFKKGLALSNQIPDPSDRLIVESYATGNMGMAYNSMDSLNLARDHLTKAIMLTRTLGDPYTTSIYLAELGLVEQKEGHMVQAEENLMEAYEMAIQEGLKEQIRDFSGMLVDFYTYQQAYEQALSYQQTYQQYQDSLVNKENLREVEQIKANYEIDKRDSEIGLLNQINRQQQVLAVGLGVGLLLIAGFASMIYRTNGRLKVSNAEVSKREQEKALLLHELNHRAKNNLQMISSLLTLQEGALKGHPARAAITAGKNRVKALSLIHRKLYQQHHHTKVDLEGYLSELVQNLCHSFGVKWKPQLELIPLQLHVDKAIPLALIINELVTNALKYAYVDHPTPALVVKITNDSDHLMISVKDNGIGIDTTQQYPGLGSRLVQSLIEQIEGKLELLEGPGTHWQLTMNI